MKTQTPGDVLFEYTKIGHSVRVTAVDADSGTEVTIQAPASLSQFDMQSMAMKEADLRSQ